MTNLSPRNWRELEQQRWQPTRWSDIAPRDFIALALKDGTVAVGTVDEYTADRSVFWVMLSGSNERRFFLSSEVHGAFLRDKE
jgi:hypothetical protein